MKFTIEVEDFWLDDEEELEPALTRFIIQEVTRKIDKSIKEKVDKCIVDFLQKEFDINYSKKVKAFVSESFDNGELKVGQGNEEVAAKEFFIKRAKTAWGHNPVKETLEKLAKVHTEEIKQRYDLYYASHVVSKLSENGFLKDEIINKLLKEK